VAAATALVAPAAVMAQESGAKRLEEVVVTARRTEENLQDIPIAVTAFTGEMMRKRNMRELEDVALATSGLAFEDYGGGFGQPVVRGGSAIRIQDLDTVTSVFLDGVYLPRQYMYDIGTVGFERIEVIKGPQSALYGRNAFLGAVNYVSKRPGQELDAQIELTAGSDELLEYTAEIGGPIIADKLGARFVVAHSEFDGSWENDHPNAGLNIGSKATEGNVSGWENDTYGLIVDFTPTENLSFEFDYYRVERFAESQASLRVEAPIDTNCSPTFFGQNRFYCGEIPDRFTPLPGGSPADAEIVRDPRSYSLDVQSDLARARVDYQFNDTWSVMYQFGYSDSETTAAGGGDRDPLLGNAAFGGNVINGTPAGTNEFSSHEFKLQFSSGQWNAFVGVFHSEIEDYDRFDLGIATLAGTDPYIVDPTQGITSGAFFVLPLTSAATDVTTDAIYGQVSWDSSDGRWTVTAEGRYADEEKALDPNTNAPDGPRFKDNWTEFTPRFSVDYNLSDGSMVYASVARGAKSGGFNNTVFDESQRAFDPDYNWTYELGTKNELLDGSLRLNAAIYYTAWDDLQIASSPIGIPPGTTPPAIVDNTAGATIMGAELDGVWYIGNNFSVDFALTKIATEFDDGSKSSRIGLIGGCDGIVCPADGDISGNSLPRQPETQLALGAEFSGQLSAGWDWSVRGDVSHQSKQYIDELELSWLPSRTLFNARAEMNVGKLNLALWGKNLTDERYGAAAFFIATPFGTSYVPIFGQLRTYGLTARYTF
jgi:iron complex outermembrane receptor protein